MKLAKEAMKKEAMSLYKDSEIIQEADDKYFERSSREIHFGESRDESDYRREFGFCKIDPVKLEGEESGDDMPLSDKTSSTIFEDINLKRQTSNRLCKPQILQRGSKIDYLIILLTDYDTICENRVILEYQIAIDNEENHPDDPMDVDYTLYNLSGQLPVDNTEYEEVDEESEYEDEDDEYEYKEETYTTNSPIENTSNNRPAIENVSELMIFSILYKPASDVVTIKCKINKLSIP
nr:12782_t:CDS:2 [Entrophospora candida]